jgi:hypothetical protein
MMQLYTNMSAKRVDDERLFVRGTGGACLLDPKGRSLDEPALLLEWMNSSDIGDKKLYEFLDFFDSVKMPDFAETFEVWKILDTISDDGWSRVVGGQYGSDQLYECKTVGDYVFFRNDKGEIIDLASKAFFAEHVIKIERAIAYERDDSGRTFVNFGYAPRRIVEF